MPDADRKDALPESAPFVERLANELTVPVRLHHAPPGTLAAVAVRLSEEGQTLQRTNSSLIRQLFSPGHAPLTPQQQSGIEALVIARAANLRAQVEIVQDLIDQATEHENAIAWLQGEVKKRDESLKSHRQKIRSADGPAPASPIESRKQSGVAALLGTLGLKKKRR